MNAYALTLGAGILTGIMGIIFFRMGRNGREVDLENAGMLFLGIATLTISFTMAGYLHYAMVDDSKNTEKTTSNPEISQQPSNNQESYDEENDSKNKRSLVPFLEANQGFLAAIALVGTFLTWIFTVFRGWSARNAEA